MSLIKKFSVIAVGCFFTTLSFAEGNTLDTPLPEEKSTLVVGIEGSSIPFVITDETTGEYNGFDIDFINAIAREAGYSKLIFKDMPFDALMPSVLTGQVDIAISMITITEERAQIVDFIGPYYNTHLDIMINRKYADRIKRANDLKGKKICVKNATTCEMFAQTIPNGNLISYLSEREVFQGARNNECVAVITNEPVIKYYLRNYNEDNMFVSLNAVHNPAKFGIMIAKGQDAMKERIAKALNSVMATPYFKDMCDHWFGDSEGQLPQKAQ